MRGLQVNVVYIDEMSNIEGQYDEVFRKPCLICGRENRFHKVFWSPRMNGYMRQMTEDSWLPKGVELVPSSNHYACIDNLEYLEYLDGKK